MYMLYMYLFDDCLITPPPSLPTHYLLVQFVASFDIAPQTLGFDYQAMPAAYDIRHFI